MLPPLLLLVVFAVLVATVTLTIKGWSISCTCGGNEGMSLLEFHVMVTLSHVESIFAVSACASSGLNSGIIGLALSRLNPSL